MSRPIEDDLKSERKKRQITGEEEYFDFYSLGSDNPQNETEKEEQEETEEEEEELRGLPREIYCDIANTLREECTVASVLDLWEHDEEKIKALTKEEILWAINNVKEK